MKKIFTIIIPIIVFSACQKNIDRINKDELTSQEKIVVPSDENLSARTFAEVEYNTFYGPVVQMGEGHVRSWVNITHDNKPLAIGIEMTDGAIN